MTAASVTRSQDCPYGAAAVKLLSEAGYQVAETVQPAGSGLPRVTVGHLEGTFQQLVAWHACRKLPPPE